MDTKKKAASPSIEIGDEIIYTGSVRYHNANDTEAYAALGGRAVVKDVCKGAAHPYYIESVKGSGSSIYGWVDAKYIVKKEG